MDLDEEELKATREMKAINKVIAPVEKSADELFEKLKYYKRIESDSHILYECHEIAIEFDLKTKGVTKYIYYSSINCYGCKEISMQELKAINKKCKELRMVSLIIYIIANIILLIGLYLLGYERGKVETIRKIYEKDIDKVRDLIDKVEKLR